MGWGVFETKGREGFPLCLDKDVPHVALGGEMLNSTRLVNASAQQCSRKQSSRPVSHLRAVHDQLHHLSLVMVHAAALLTSRQLWLAAGDLHETGVINVALWKEYRLLAPSGEPHKTPPSQPSQLRACKAHPSQTMGSGHKRLYPGSFRICVISGFWESWFLRCCTCL